MNKKLAIIAVSLTILAALLGVGVNVGIGSLLAVPEGTGGVDIRSEANTRTEPDRRATRSTSSVSGGRYIKDIIRRNIFDHTKVGVSSSGSSGPESQTDLDYKLVLTMVAVPSSFSSAVIAPKDGDGSAYGYGIGDKLEDAEIIDIQQRLVKLKRGDQIELLTMEEDKTSSRRGTSGKSGSLSDDEGIEKIGENSYAIDQSIVDKYLGNLEALQKMVRTSPHRGSDGEIDGYRLSGVRRNTPLDKLGIKNGDVIKGVNNTPLTSLSNAMGAYNSMQQETNFSFEIARRGQDVKLNYEIR